MQWYRRSVAEAVIVGQHVTAAEVQIRRHRYRMR
jgi:hypothetical protein